jgi:hypothetical protein
MDRDIEATDQPVRREPGDRDRLLPRIRELAAWWDKWQHEHERVHRLRDDDDSD